MSAAMFEHILKFLYTGQFSLPPNHTLDDVFEYLRVADEEYLEDIKFICEKRLIELCEGHNFIQICKLADFYNANRLKEYCAWFSRRNIDQIKQPQ